MRKDEVIFYLTERDRPVAGPAHLTEELAELPRFLKGSVRTWVWRTYFHLRKAGVPCRLSEVLPEEGIVVVAACTLPLRFKPGKKLFVVECVADTPPRFYSQCQVYQSASQAAAAPVVGRFPRVVFMPHWSQPRLVARDEARGGLCVNVDYVGAKGQLAPELAGEDFARRLERAGMKFRPRHEVFDDYASTDLVLAARDFSGVEVRHKPGSKLMNAWRAGVPAILGVEGGFRELRRSELDYIEVKSVAECVAACERLRDEAGLRRAMVENGRRRALDFTDERIAERWRVLLQEEIPAWRERWAGTCAAERGTFYLRSAALRYAASLGRRARKLFS